MSLNHKPSTSIFPKLIHQIQREDFKLNHRKKAEDFTRQRVLNFVDLMMIQINRLVLSLSVEIEKFLALFANPLNYSKQAFSKARQKLKHSAFIELNEHFVLNYYQHTDFFKQFQEKYLLLAVDGSLVQLPDSEDIGKHFALFQNTNGKGILTGRASLIYDVLNRVILSASLASYKTGERILFNNQYDLLCQQRSESHLKCLFIMDRGYPSFELCKKLDLAEEGFIIRSKADFCREVKAFVEDDIEESDIYLSPRSWYKNGRAKVSKYTEGLNVRVVRLLLSSGKYEYLLTNTEFDIPTLSKLYQLRWGVETCYGFLKEKMQLENFSSKSKEGILQDFHATILTANLSQLLIQEAQQELDEEKEQADQKSKANKHTYQINQNVALGILRDQIPGLFAKPQHLFQNLDKLRKKIKKYKVAIFPDRSFPRNKLKRTRRKFHLTKKRAF